MSDLIEILRSLLEAQRRAVLSEQSVAVSAQQETAYRSLGEELSLRLTEEANIQKLKGGLLLTDLSSYELPYVDILIRSRSVRSHLLSSSGSQARIAPVYVYGHDSRGRGVDSLTGLATDGHTSTARGGYARSLLPDRPKGYWPLMDPGPEAARDWAEGNHGVFVGSTSPRSEWALDGDVLGLGDFSGGHVAVPHVLAYDGWTAMTIELWCRPRSLPMGLVAKTVSPSHKGFWLWLEADGLHAGFSDGTNVVRAVGSVSIAVGNNYHIAMTYDGTTARYYVNGGLRGSTSVGPGFLGSNKALRIGRDAEGRSSDGNIGHVALYDRALSATTLSAHASFGEGYDRPLFLTSRGLMAVDYVGKGELELTR